ncbi:hypothetical protein ColTof3_06176 [Colletotrichum tofieldiae]|nr:hypothetical protein ColTof3_06176 [Colletotrichum tofieldiae]
MHQAKQIQSWGERLEASQVDGEAQYVEQQQQRQTSRDSPPESDTTGGEPSVGEALHWGRDRLGQVLSVRWEASPAAEVLTERAHEESVSKDGPRSPTAQGPFMPASCTRVRVLGALGALGGKGGLAWKALDWEAKLHLLFPRLIGENNTPPLQ